MLISCEHFIALYSDLRDGELSLPLQVEARSHLAECASCARYDRVIRGGVALAKDLPAIEPSPDFLSRLQHRILHVEEERRAGGRRLGSGIPPAIAVALAASIAVAAWLPTSRPDAATDPVPPVRVVDAGPGDGPDLFAVQPPLAGSSSVRDVWALQQPPAPSLLFQHSPLGQSVREAVEVRYTRGP